MIKALLIIGLAFGFIGCGGGTGVTLPAGYTLPPMPDETENSATVAGIDSNSNGVRDDVEIYIYTHYEKVDEQRSQMQSARNIQDAIVNVHTKAEVHVWWDELSKASQCGNIVFKDISKAGVMYKEILSLTLNTIERVKADKEVDKLSSGELFPSSKKENPCE